MKTLKPLIEDFCKEIKEKEEIIYNEFSLQHELGMFLRKKLQNCKVEFERNVTLSVLNFGMEQTCKKEMDIVVYTLDGREKYAIEVKYPCNKQYPEQMFSFIKDIKFMEELQERGADRTYCLCVVDDPCFYSSGRKKEGIYSYFRCGNEITGKITKPTGKKDESFEIKGKYKIVWKELDDIRHYYLIEIQKL